MPLHLLESNKFLFKGSNFAQMSMNKSRKQGKTLNQLYEPDLQTATENKGKS